MRRLTLCFLFFMIAGSLFAQIDSFSVRQDILVCIDKPAGLDPKKETIICFFALPNGNTIQQTFGKKLQPGDDWHFDIQHVGAQTEYIRRQMPEKNFVVIYLANTLKSWPSWKRTHADYKQLIPALIDSLAGLVKVPGKTIYLNGHSGGGSLLFGYLEGLPSIPARVKRISFIDSNYGYDSSYYDKVKTWLQQDRSNTLTVFAYNDSVALYNGKPVVSATGGTWYRSHKMLEQLSADFKLKQVRNDSLIQYQTPAKNICFILKTNPEQKIFHTQQVELNGFIHSVLLGTKRDSKDYQYFGPRAYTEFIRLSAQ